MYAPNSITTEPGLASERGSSKLAFVTFQAKYF
jgi:hypothetical protein